MNIFAHAGEEHATNTDSLTHVVKENGWQILAVTAVFVLIALAISRYSKSQAKKSHAKPEPIAEEE